MPQILILGPWILRGLWVELKGYKPGWKNYVFIFTTCNGN